MEILGDDEVERRKNSRKLIKENERDVQRNGRLLNRGNGKKILGPFRKIKV